MGDGGIPKVSLGGLGPLALLRLPGTGGFKRGTGEDDMARLFCLSPGKNNSLGSAKVARSAALEVDTLKRGGRKGSDQGDKANKGGGEHEYG